MVKEEKFWQRIAILLIPLLLFSGFVIYLDYKVKIVEEKNNFCISNGGNPMKSDYSTYGEILCGFYYQNQSITYDVGKVVPEYKDFNYSYDYCFSCWSDRDCSNYLHNEILRDKGVHC